MINGASVRSGNKMAGDEMVFSLVQEHRLFGLALLSGMRAPRLKQTFLARRQRTMFLFQERSLSFLGEVQVWNGLEQDLRVGM